MNAAKLRALIDLINEAVNEDGLSANEKRDQVLNAASESDLVNLSEFSSWFLD